MFYLKGLYTIISLVLCIVSLNAQIVFFEMPEHFNPKLEVASCYILHKGRILFLKRCASSSWSHTWGLPGGSIDENESALSAMKREVFEETGIDLSRENILFLRKVYVRDSQKDFIYYMFKCELGNEPEKIILVQDEHTEYRWLTVEQALEELSLIPGEDECLCSTFKINL